MPIKLRRRIFYCLILAFVVLGTGAVLYAKGWRLSLQPLKFVKVGAIYLRTAPTDVQIALDGVLQPKSSGLFDKSVLLNDLLPAAYDLQVSAAGFQSWNMRLAVQSSLVTAMQYIVLVPTQAASATTTPVQAISPIGSTFVLKTAAGMRTLSGMAVPGDSILASSEDGTVILTSFSSTHSYLETNLSQATTTDLGRLSGQSFEPVPGDATLFLAASPTGLNLLRVPTGDTLSLATTSVTAMAAVPGRAIWATFDPKTRTSLLSYYDISSRSFNTDADSLPGRITKILSRDDENLFILSEDGSLYSLNLGQSSRIRLDQGVREFVLTKSHNELAVLDTQGVQVFFLQDDQPDLHIDIPNAATAGTLAWYRDDEHLFVQYPDHVAFLDLADTALKNYANVAASGHTQYATDNNILYFLKDNTLYQLSFPGS